MYEFESGDVLMARTIASTTNPVDINFAIRYDDGSSDMIPMQINHPGDRTVQLDITPESLTGPGKVIGLSADVGATAIKRGQFFTTYFIRRTVPGIYPIAAFYAASDFFGGLGYFESPLSGRGHVSWQTLASDVAGDTDTTTALALSNAFRKILAIVVYYNASGDAATRTIRMRLDRIGGAPPTGFTANGNDDIWDQAPITLTANQEGAMYTTDGYSVGSDNGTKAIEDDSSAPNPFPLYVEENDNARILIIMGAGHANDTYSAYAQIEEWLEE